MAEHFFRRGGPAAGASLRAVAMAAGAQAGAPVHEGLLGALPFGAALRRQILSIGLVAALLWLLRERLAGLDMAAIAAAFGQVGAAQWLLAGLATFASFAALAQYDALIHRSLGTGTTGFHARRAGWSAIAISQSLGFGLVSGALVRWRMLPGATLGEAAKITATVAATFLAAWAVLTAHVLLLAPVELPGLPVLALQGFALLGLGAGGALGLAALIRPELRLGHFSLRLPPLAVMGRILGLAALDTGLAALALWALLPADSGLSLWALYPAFLLALGAGFVSGTPGGLGPFEITLLTLVPQLPEPGLMAAVLAWRVAYYAVPAALALALVALRPANGLGSASARLVPGSAIGAFLPGSVSEPYLPGAARGEPALARLLTSAPQAELGLLRQGEHGVLLTGPRQSAWAEEGVTGGWMIGRGERVLAGLFDPFGTAALPELLPELHRAARAEGRLACLYKISPRSAAQVRAAGWVVAPVANEVWLDPRQFSLHTPERAGLRRKLRKAEKAGVEVSLAPSALPMADLAALANRWAQARGGERGFSMGRFAPAYIAAQELVLAWQAGRLVGFASFHASAEEWTLDLMRPDPAAPDGTMQALIVCALQEAAKRGLARLSLAALPPLAETVDGPAAHIWRRAEQGAGAAGLRQFKMSFAPRLSPRYIAAPSRAALALAAADIARAIHRPAPLPGTLPAARTGRHRPALCHDAPPSRSS